MVKESSFGSMVKSISVGIREINATAKAFICSRMGAGMLETLSMTRKVGAVLFTSQKVACTQVT